jgi:RNase adaptor protein for sRNA GlmZ degradation
MVKAMSAADRTVDLELNLIEFGSMAIANLASHLEPKLTDCIIAADGHLATISVVSDGRVTEAAALASTRALHNLAAGNIRGQVIACC